MNLTWSPEDLAFKDEVRRFLDRQLTDDLRSSARRMTSVYADYQLAMRWQKILHAQGWIAPSWPVEYGGCGWSIVQRYIFASELAAASAPPVSPMGIGMCGPVLIGHGTEAQKARYLPPMLSGEEFWCQGYSEPGSGSDLASLGMSAVENGDSFICNGHKLWTTHANVANWVFCLVRTAREGPPQRGISFLLIDMRTPGVEVQPIISLCGEHIQNHIFFTDVPVPKSQVVGKVGDGWTVAKYLMQFERGGSVVTPGLRVRLERIQIAIEEISDAKSAPDTIRADHGEGRQLLRQLAEACIAVDALEALELSLMSKLSVGEAPGANSSLLKTLSTELSQRLTEIALVAGGDYAAVFQPHVLSPGGPVPGYRQPNDPSAVGPSYCWSVAAKYLNDRAGSIYAGTNEIQRNIMAKTALGL